MEEKERRTKAPGRARFGSRPVFFFAFLLIKKSQHFVLLLGTFPLSFSSSDRRMSPYFADLDDGLLFEEDSTLPTAALLALLGLAVNSGEAVEKLREEIFGVGFGRHCERG